MYVVLFAYYVIGRILLMENRRLYLSYSASRPSASVLDIPTI